MERSFTFKRPTNRNDITSALVDETKTYVGPEKMMLVVNADQTWSPEHIPMSMDDWVEAEDLETPEDGRYLVLNANNNDHIVLMALIHNENISEELDDTVEFVKTYTYADGSTFDLYNINDQDTVGLGEVIDVQSVRIDENDIISYDFHTSTPTVEEFIEIIETDKILAEDKKMAAEFASHKALWTKLIELLNLIKADAETGVIPFETLPIPNVADVELGRNCNE